MDEHPFFKNVPIEHLSGDNFDARMKGHESELVGVFFWGKDCPNCEVAKEMLNQARDEFAAIPIRWFHVNVYEDWDLGTRFGLFGIPVFLFFREGKRLGRISPFPGLAPFFEALRHLVASQT